MRLTDAQSRVIPLLERRMRPGQIADDLGWTRQRLYAVLDGLTAGGILTRWGDLPSGARRRTWPPESAMDEASAVLAELGADPPAVRSLILEQTRAGMRPPPAGDRHSRTDWSGHMIRRVEWFRDGCRWVVQGLLIPRADGRPWHKATPGFRAVVVSHGHEQWVSLGLMERQLILPQRTVFDRWRHFQPDAYRDVTLAAAWTLEARALLDAELLEAWEVNDEAR